MDAVHRHLAWAVAWMVVAGVVLAGGAARAEDDGDLALPEAAAKAIAQEFPDAAIVDVETEREYGLELYEAELRYKGRELDVAVSPDGVIVAVEAEVKEIPEAVEAAIRARARGGRIVEMEKAEIRAVYVESLGQLCELKEPVIVYELEFVKDGDTYEARVRADGKLLGLAEQDEEGDDGEDD